MITLLSVQLVEIITAILVGIVLIGGITAHILHKKWAKKHGKSPCGGNCGACSYCQTCTDIKNKTNKQNTNKQN